MVDEGNLLLYVRDYSLHDICKIGTLHLQGWPSWLCWPSTRGREYEQGDVLWTRCDLLLHSGPSTQLLVLHSDLWKICEFPKIATLSWSYFGNCVEFETITTFPVIRNCTTLHCINYWCRVANLLLYLSIVPVWKTVILIRKLPLWRVSLFFHCWEQCQCCS
jgi:hypothetical protein